MNCGKAPRRDSIQFEFYKNALDAFLNKIVKLFIYIYLLSQVPECFKKSIMFPLNKKGDVNNVANYRGISFMFTSAKLFTGL